MACFVAWSVIDTVDLDTGIFLLFGLFFMSYTHAVCDGAIFLFKLLIGYCQVTLLSLQFVG